jgi:predicted nucleotidyltransferase
MLLREKDIIRLRQLFSSITLPVEIWAYGSRVNGTAHAGSDLDLVLKARSGNPIPVFVFYALQQQLAESNIPIIVQLSDWAKLPESFRENINARKELLFSNYCTDSIDSAAIGSSFLHADGTSQ